MQTLVYFLIWGAFFFFMMRFGCGAHVMGHGHRHSGASPEAPASTGEARWTPPTKDVDPVCGMTIETAGAKSTIYEGHAYYFCSQTCREKFEASPRSFMSGPVSPPREMEHSHERQH